MLPKSKLLLCLVQAFGAAAAAPTVRVGSISYVGTVSPGVESFLNIRFAHDSGGQRRFKHPEPYSYPEGTVVNASSPGAACPQTLGNPLPEFDGIFGNTAKISEDCLTVRVSRPRGTCQQDRLPVMAFLLGAGYAFGNIYDDTAYGPDGLIRGSAAKGLPVVYVAINYRTGFFGFAASEALRKEDNLNAGLLDQYAGLQWIQDNIEFFGGDPDNVTIFGEDVGWTNVQLQLTAYGGAAEPLFRKAILQSGPTPAGSALTSGLSEKHTLELTAALGCTSSTPDGGAEIACLRSLPVETVNAAALNFSLSFASLGGIGTFRPTVPSSFIPDAPSKLLATGQFRKDVDIIVGWNENDGSIFVPEATNSTEYFLAVMEGLFPGLSSSNIQALLLLYPESDFLYYPEDDVDRNFFRASQAARDAFFTCPSLWLVKAWCLHAPESQVFTFALNETVFALGHAQYSRSFVGIDHFSDIPYVFDYVNTAAYAPLASQADYDMASRASGSWAAFARYGRPTMPDLSDEEIFERNLTFPGWTAGGGRIRVLGGPRDGMMLIDRTYNESLAERCGFWGRDDVLAQTWN